MSAAVGPRPATLPVRLYAEGPNGCRRAAIDWPGGAEIMIQGLQQETIDTAARQIATLHAHASALTAEVEQLRCEKAILQTKILPARPASLLGPGCVRFRDGHVYLLNGRERGWARWGVRMESWDELFRRFDCRVTEHCVDEWGSYWLVVPCASGVSL